MTTTTRPTLLLKKGDRVWVTYHRGTIRSHSPRTGRYFLEMDDWPGQRLHEKFIYRNRNEMVKIGGD